MTIHAFFVVLFLLNGQAQVAGPWTSRFKAVAFDYFVICEFPAECDLALRLFIGGEAEAAVSTACNAGR